MNNKIISTLLCIIFAGVLLINPLKAKAAFNWADYFTKDEATTIKKMVDKYIRGQIEEDAKNWKGIIGKKQVDDTIVKQKVYTGTINCSESFADDTTASPSDPDEITYYKKISIPEIDLSEIPQVSLYVKITSEDDRSQLGNNLWSNRTITITDDYAWFSFGDSDTGDPISCSFSEYKILVNY